MSGELEAKAEERLSGLIKRRSRVDGCAYCKELAENGGWGPSHDASQNCQSGKRSHCTCDTCF